MAPGGSSWPSVDQPVGSSSGADVTPESGLPSSRTTSAPRGRPARPIARRRPTRVRPIAAIPSDDHAGVGPVAAVQGAEPALQDAGDRQAAAERDAEGREDRGETAAHAQRHDHAGQDPAEHDRQGAGVEHETAGVIGRERDHVGRLRRGLLGVRRGHLDRHLLEHLGDCRAAGRGGQHLDPGRAHDEGAGDLAVLDGGDGARPGSRTAGRPARPRRVRRPWRPRSRPPPRPGRPRPRAGSGARSRWPARRTR